MGQRALQPWLLYFYPVQTNVNPQEVDGDGDGEAGKHRSVCTIFLYRQTLLHSLAYLLLLLLLLVIIRSDCMDI